ncbi:MAG: tyrosine-type recombinase/integrase, partial [Phycisphaerales bacterium]
AYVRRMLPRMARRAAIEKRVHAHGLRHTHAAQLASEGVPINVISRQLGHSNVGTTSRYIDHISPTQVIETMRARDWAIG